MLKQFSYREIKKHLTCNHPRFEVLVIIGQKRVKMNGDWGSFVETGIFPVDRDVPENEKRPPFMNGGLLLNHWLV